MKAVKANKAKQKLEAKVIEERIRQVNNALDKDPVSLCTSDVVYLLSEGR